MTGISTASAARCIAISAAVAPTLTAEPIGPSALVSVAEFATVFADDPGVGQGAGEGGLAESRIAGDRG